MTEIAKQLNYVPRGNRVPSKADKKVARILMRDISENDRPDIKEWVNSFQYPFTEGEIIYCGFKIMFT